MKAGTDGHIKLELLDVIRVNQLVRGGADTSGAISWFREVSHEEQNALLGSLLFFAAQAGFDEASWEEALIGAEHEDGAIIERVRAHLFRSFPRDYELVDWFASLDDLSRSAIYVLVLRVFAAAEGRRVRGEQKEHCNHWWHRDLLDERVVEDILNDPNFHMTSMADDEWIRSHTLRGRIIRFFRRSR